MAKVLRWADDRTGQAQWARSAMRHVFPDHFTFMFGEIAVYAFSILVATGVYLTMFFEPSATEVTYQGSYQALDGVTMSRAYESAVRLSLDVRFGLLVRQMHHWAALVFVMAILLHLSRVFFTGAFRRPRELNWLVGVTLLLLAISNGFLGYSLVDDLLSGTGLRIAYSIAESVPIIGTWVASLFFGGEFPADAMIPRMFVMHILVVPAMIVGLLSVHLALVWRQKHTQFPGPGRSEHNVVGSPLWPSYAARSLSLFLAVGAVVALLGGLAQINPIWLWGPYEPYNVTTGAQPDWYVGWLEGALRLYPPWELRLFDHTIPSVFVPGVLLPGLTFAGLYAYPFVEKRLTGDRAEHELLERPRDRPRRVAFGAGVLAFYAVLFVAGSQDILAAWLGVSLNTIVATLRVALFVVPVIVATAAGRWAGDLGRKAALDTDATRPRAPHPKADPAGALVDDITRRRSSVSLVLRSRPRRRR